MNKNLKKWLPAIITLTILLIIILITSFNNSLPTFELKEKKTIDYSKINEIIKMLDNDEEKKKASNALEELYKGYTKDDTYYLTSAKIIMETGNDIDAVGTLNYVNNKTVEYYKLMVRATAGQFFTMGQVPDGLLNTAIDASEKYSNNIDFQLLAGKLYYDKDNYTAALYYLDKALQIDENNVDANYYYALCIYILGEQQEGISYMTKAQKLYKGNDSEYKKSMSNYIDIMKEGKR